jgi:hypothetical protein
MDRYSYTAGSVTLDNYGIDYDDDEAPTTDVSPAFIIRDRTKVIAWTEDRDDAEKIVAVLNKSVDT